MATTTTSVHPGSASAQFSYNYSNRLDSMLRRASLQDHDLYDLTLEGNTDSNPQVDPQDSKLDTASRYKVPMIPCNLVTTARVDAMIRRLEVSDDDDDLELVENSDNTITGTPFRRAKSLMYRIKKKVSRTMKRTTSMNTMKL